MNTCIKALTDPDISWLQGRNGLFDIKAVIVRAWRLYGKEPDTASIDGISAKKGVVLNGGLQFSIGAMDKLAIEWCLERNLLILNKETEAALEEVMDMVDGSNDNYLNTVLATGKLLVILATEWKETNDKRRTS